MKKSIVFLVLVAILTGCQTGSTPKQETVEITHKLGTIQVQTNPEKIAVFDMGVADTLHELGIEVAAAPVDSLPKQINKEGIENGGSLFEPNFELLASLNLDLIIISGRMSDQYDALSDIAPVLYLENDPTNLMGNLEEKLQTLKTIYPELNYETKFSALQKEVEDLKAKADGRETLFLMANGQEIKAFGEGSRYDFVFSTFGFKNADVKIEVSNHGMMLSFEQVQALNPDIILVMDRGQIVGSDTLAPELLDNAMIKSTKAFTENAVIYLDPEVWYLQEGGMNAIHEIVQNLLPLYDM